MSAAALPSGLFHRVADLIGAVCEAAVTQLVSDPQAGPLILVICGLLRDMALDFEALVARLDAAGPGANGPGAAGPGAAGPGADGQDANGRGANARARPRTPRPPRPIRLPRVAGWLVRLVPGVEQFGARLSAMLDDPTLPPLLSAAPRARRLLRSVWRMLCTDPVPPVLRAARRRRPAAARATVEPAREAAAADVPPASADPVVAPDGGSGAALHRCAGAAAPRREGGGGGGERARLR